MTADSRDEILDLIQQVYWLKFNKKSASAPKLKLFGVSVKQLAEFVTSEKDLQRKINRMPNDYYLVNDESAKSKGTNADNKMLENLDDPNDEELDDFFDFEFIEKDELLDKIKPKSKNEAKKQ